MRFRDLIAAVKSSRDLDRSFVWTRGSQEASSAIRGSGFHNASSLYNEIPDFAICEIPTDRWHNHVMTGGTTK